MSSGLWKAGVAGSTPAPLITNEKGHSILECQLWTMERGKVNNKIIKGPETDAQMLKLQDFIIEALQNLIKAQVVKYNDLVEAATTKIVVKKPLYVDAKTIIDHGSDTLKAKFKEHINKTPSIEDLLMDDNVSKEQIIGIMYDALNTMQRYNGNTVTNCLIEAIKDSGIVYEE